MLLIITQLFCPTGKSRIGGKQKHTKQTFWNIFMTHGTTTKTEEEEICVPSLFFYFLFFYPWCFFEAKCDFRKPLVTEGSAGGRSGSSRTCIWDTKMSMYCMYFSVFLYIRVFLSSVPLNYIRTLYDKKNYVSRNQAFYGGRGERW